MLQESIGKESSCSTIKEINMFIARLFHSLNQLYETGLNLMYIHSSQLASFFSSFEAAIALHADTSKLQNN